MSEEKVAKEKTIVVIVFTFFRTTQIEQVSLWISNWQVREAGMWPGARKRKCGGITVE